MITKILMNGREPRENVFDCRRIQECLYNHGYMSDLQDCYDLWEDVSEDYCAGWLFLPDNEEELWRYIESKVKEIAP